MTQGRRGSSRGRGGATRRNWIWNISAARYTTQTFTSHSAASCGAVRPRSAAVRARARIIASSVRPPRGDGIVPFAVEIGGAGC